MLEQHAGEPMRAQVLHQDKLTWNERCVAEFDDEGLWTSGEEVLRRTVMLRGKATDRAYLHATSSIALERLPFAVRAGLLSSDTPFGWLLHSAQLRITRTGLTWSEPFLGDLCALFDGLSFTTRVMRRTYVMRLADSVPIARLTETFPAIG